MKIFVPVPIRVASSSAARRSRAVEWKIASKRGLFPRFRHFIESNGRVERCVCNRWIDEACVGVIVVSALYFLPILVPLLLE
jgi:hypothetical protein